MGRVIALALAGGKMATEMKIWRVSDQKKLELIQEVPFPANNLEKDLESWIENSPEILGEDLLVVARQLVTPVGRLDLLCIDSDCMPVIVELKRDSTPREAIAQSLDYASWLDTLSEDEFRGLTKPYLTKPLEEAFSEHFDKLLKIDCQKHRIILVAPKLDAAAERIINYLAERYGVGVNAVFFKYAQLGSEKILARTLLVSEEVRISRQPFVRKPRPAPEDLDRIAADRNVSALVDICRQMKDVWDEEPSTILEGAWTYSLTTDKSWRLLFRIDVSGGRLKTPVGELDLWVRYKNVAEVTATDDAAVRNVLQTGYLLQAEKSGNLIIRLRTKVDAEKFVQQMKEWVSSSKLQDGIAPEVSNVDLH
jgi:hypothetical protein